MAEWLKRNTGPRGQADGGVMDARRRQLLHALGTGTLLSVLGGCYQAADEERTREARAMTLPDGRPRLPPGQHLIERLRPMGGEEGDPDPGRYRLRVHGLVSTELDLSYEELLESEVVEQEADVHCVTRWSRLDCRWKGVQVAHLAKLAGVKDTAAHVIFEAANGYTSNVPLKEALLPANLVAWRLDGDLLEPQHGTPVRGVVPHLYFWKSAKWLTGIRFVARDEPGFWEVRGYHNHADPWLEERYS